MPVEMMQTTDHYPEIERLQGAILVPVKIQKVTVDKDGEKKDVYQYAVVKVPDKGQEITQDKMVFAAANRLDVDVVADPSWSVAPKPRKWIKIVRGKSVSIVPAIGAAMDGTVVLSGDRETVLGRKSA